MDLDISDLMEHWDYKPGQVVVRKFKGKDGRDKIQLRVDLGLLQMNREGRPDGKRPFGHETLFAYYQKRFDAYLGAHNGNPEGYKLKADDCSRLQLEALQFHHRYICLLQLGDYEAVVRDANHNLALFDFVGKFAPNEDLSWSLRQFQPQLLMILTRARAMQRVEIDDYAGAIALIEQGQEQIENFYRSSSRAEMLEQCGEIQSLQGWLVELRANRPLSAREKLQQALSDAVQREDYERAAQMRDALRNLKEG